MQPPSWLSLVRAVLTQGPTPDQGHPTGWRCVAGGSGARSGGQGAERSVGLIRSWGLGGATPGGEKQGRPPTHPGSSSLSGRVVTGWADGGHPAPPMAPGQTLGRRCVSVCATAPWCPVRGAPACMPWWPQGSAGLRLSATEAREGRDTQGGAGGDVPTARGHRPPNQSFRRTQAQPSDLWARRGRDGSWA